MERLNALSQKRFRSYVRNYFKGHPLRNKMIANAHILFQKREDKIASAYIAAPCVEVPIPMPAPKPSKPVTPAEYAAAFARDLDTIIAKYPSHAAKAIVERMLGKAQGLLAKAA